MIGSIKIAGLDANGISFLSALTRGTDEGKPVTISANNTVALAADDGVISCKVLTIDAADGVAVVQTRGFAEFSYSGTAPTVGAHQALVGNGAGGVKIKSSAAGDKHFDIVSVDTTNTLVVVNLG